MGGHDDFDPLVRAGLVFDPAVLDQLPEEGACFVSRVGDRLGFIFEPDLRDIQIVEVEGELLDQDLAVDAVGQLRAVGVVDDVKARKIYGFVQARERLEEIVAYDGE